jgi:hypothetical protein
MTAAKVEPILGTTFNFIILDYSMLSTPKASWLPIYGLGAWIVNAIIINMSQAQPLRTPIGAIGSILQAL